ncbi:MAG: hypothetical protein DMG40_02540 [Acidobacteria bacterium]|nr:MAG: hypothetical protein DMG40_02540 [Acidobacteriota bacterium]
MFPRQHHADAHNDAQHQTDYETKTCRVTHRALRQIEDPGRFIPVHRPTLGRIQRSASAGSVSD